MEYSEINMRQTGLLPEAFLSKSIQIVGIGGIGSPTAYLLAKLGIRDLTLIDFDTVETHNVGSQFYSLEDVGRPKVEALQERIKRELGFEANIINEKISELPKSDITIFATDSMDSRIQLYKTIDSEYLIDARMGLEFMRVYCLSTFDSVATDQYEKNLYPSSEAVSLPCTERAVCYNTFFIGSIIASLVKKCLLGEDMPFETIADISEMKMVTFSGKAR